MALSFRRAVPDDLPALHALVETAYRGDASRAGWTTEADLIDGQRTDREELESLMSSPTKRFVLGFLSGDGEGDELVASVLVSDEGDAAYVGMFVVRPVLQGRGLGKLVLAEAERIAREELGRRVVRMQVIAQRDELIAWYARRGYAPTGERAPFPYGNARAGAPKRDDLEFVILRKELP
jgi:ribosomal protein S18 acetylase RimI-like enzyme